MMTFGELYRRGKRLLSASPDTAENGSMEAFFLFWKATGLSREALLLRGAEPCPAEQQDCMEQLLRRRLSGEPLQYLLGEWEFFGLPLSVGPGVLIPRADTERLVELVLEQVPESFCGAMLDLCSGTGCIPLAVTAHRPGLRAWGVELSEQAGTYFQQNIDRLGLPVTRIAGDFFHLPEQAVCRKYDILTSNPPYIASAELPSLQKEVQQEPSMALDGGADGLKFYRAVPEIGNCLLNPGGLLFLEIGEEQGTAVSALLEQAGYLEIQVHQDYAGLDRVVTARRA